MKLYRCLYFQVLFLANRGNKHEAVLFIEKALIRMNDGIL